MGKPIFIKVRVKGDYVGEKKYVYVNINEISTIEDYSINDCEIFLNNEECIIVEGCIKEELVKRIEEAING